VDVTRIFGFTLVSVAMMVFALRFCSSIGKSTSKAIRSHGFCKSQILSVSHHPKNISRSKARSSSPKVYRANCRVLGSSLIFFQSPSLKVFAVWSRSYFFRKWRLSDGGGSPVEGFSMGSKILARALEHDNLHFSLNNML
jgi:hypothetical protein